MSVKSPKNDAIIGDINNYVLINEAKNYESNLSALSVKLNWHNSYTENDKQKSYETELRLRLAIDLNNMGYWDWDLETDEVKWRLRLEDSIESSAPTENKESFNSFIKRIQPEDQERVADCLHQTTIDNTDCEIEFCISLPNDSLRWVQLCAATVFFDGVPKKVVGVLQDRTELKTAREQREKLLAEAKAVQSEIIKAKKIRDEFLDNITHELKTPLNSIVGWSHLIRSVKMSKEQIEYALSVIERSAIEQKRVIEDLLGAKREIYISLHENGHANEIGRTKHNSFKNISEEKELGDLRVLVVDDDVSTGKLFEFVMAHCGAKVTSCTSAAEVMQILENWQPDALICDIGMPDIDGYTLINLIRKLPTRQSTIPAIAVTAYSSEGTRERALAAGFNEYIAKPVMPEELAKAVRAIVSSKQVNKSDNITTTQTSNGISDENKISKDAASKSIRDVATKNYLLKALSQEEYERLEPYISVVTLNAGDVLCEPDEFIKYVYFPINSVTSLLSITDDGTSIEAGMVGREGILGLPVILGVGTMSTWATVTIGGQAVRIGSKQLKGELQTGSKLHELALDYTRAFITQVSQTAVCNRRHSIEERLSTWLLLLQDSIGSRKLPLTQELISNRLGTRRPGISNCTRDLQKAGLIQNARGKIYIKDKEALESAACSCYGVIRAEYDSLYSASRDKQTGL